MLMKSLIYITLSIRDKEKEMMELIKDIFVFAVTAYCLYFAILLKKDDWFNAVFKMISWIFVIVGVLIIYDRYLK